MSNNFSNLLVNKITRQFRLIKKETAGVAAVEFALILPLMLLLYLGTMEVSIAVSVDRKLSRMASTVGDLIGQSDTQLDGADVLGIFNISNFVMSPYQQKPTIVVSGVKIDDNDATLATVSWSCANDTNADNQNSALDANSPTDIPAQIRTKGTFIIKTTVFLNYTPIIGFPDKDSKPGFGYDKTSIRLEQTVYTAPRLPTNIQVSNAGVYCKVPAA